MADRRLRSNRYTSQASPESLSIGKGKSRQVGSWDRAPGRDCLGRLSGARCGQAKSSLNGIYSCVCCDLHNEKRSSAPLHHRLYILPRNVVGVLGFFA